MPDLLDQLKAYLRDRVCVAGVGNVDLSDDGFGVRLAEAWQSRIFGPKAPNLPSHWPALWSAGASEARPRFGRGTGVPGQSKAPSPPVLSPDPKNSSAGDVRATVAQIWNLPYRRIASCRACARSKALDSADAWPIPNRRYGRVQLCATEWLIGLAPWSWPQAEMWAKSGSLLRPAGAVQSEVVATLPSRETSGLDLSAASSIEILVAGTNPERFLSKFSSGGFDSILFLDAVKLGAEPGSAALLNSAEMRSCLPQISTHKISLGLLAQLIESNSAAKVWLLGVQPESLRPGNELSPPVQATLDLLLQILT